MSEFDLTVKAPAGPETASGLVPVGYAEKAMASLMQLHSEVLEEKERRVDLHRRLMEKEQALAELKWYVKMLEEKLEKQAPAAAAVAPLRVAEPVPAAPIPITRAAVPKPPVVARQAPAAHRVPVASPPVSKPSAQGWKAW
jgi:hypothetical protein